MPEERLTLCLAGHVYFTKGKYSETIPAEMETADVRRALTRLAEYENACFDDDGNEVVDTHAIHVLRGSKPESPRPDWTPCAEAMPDTDDVYSTQPKKLYWCAIACIISGKQRVDYAALLYLRYEGREPFWCYHGSMQNLEAGDTVLAWQPLPEPYNPDRKEDAVHIVDVNKKIDQVCPKCNSMAHYDPHFGRVMCRQCGWMQEDTK